MNSIQMYVALNSELDPVSHLMTPSGHFFPRLRFTAEACDIDIASMLISQLVRVVETTQKLGVVANEFAETTIVKVDVFENGVIVDVEQAKMLGTIPRSDYEQLRDALEVKANNEDDF